MHKSGVHYMSLTFFSLNFLPSFFLFHIPLYSVPFLFSISMSPSLHPSFPSLFQTLFSNSLSLSSFPPLLSSAFHIPSDRFLCLSTFSSNAARAAFQPTASGAASLFALLMRLRAGESRKSQVEGSTQHGQCRAWMPRG